MKKYEIEIFQGIHTVNGFPVIFIDKMKTLVFSDLHLGYELSLAEKGIFIPQTQLKEILNRLREIFKRVSANKLVIVGDVKHEFGEASRQEWKEVKELIKYLHGKVKKIILVRGNHDNFLLTICNYLGIEVFDPYYYEKNICFTHGHKKINYPENTKLLIIGHEHPSLVLKERFDKIKVKCILYGKMKNGKKIICLPAFSSWGMGTDINLISPDDLLSPILREEVNLEELIPIGLEEGLPPLKFPPLKKLRTV